MNDLKKKILKLYSTLVIKQNAYRLKSGLLAGITGLSAISYSNLNMNLVKSPNTFIKISEPLYKESDYIECISQVLTNPDNLQNYTEIINDITDTLKVSDDFKMDFITVLKAVLSKDSTYEINKKQENCIYLNNSNHDSYIVIYKSPSDETLTISLPDSSNNAYTRVLAITFSKNEEVRITVRKMSNLDCEYLYQLYYMATSVNLVMVAHQPSTYKNDELQFEEIGMNYNVTGSEFDVFKTIIESYNDGATFSEISDNLKPYILNYEKLPFYAEEENLKTEENNERKLIR